MDPTINTADIGEELARARDTFATVMTWGKHLPIQLRLAAAAAFNELETRADLPYPPASPAAADPGLTLESASAHLADVRQVLVDLLPHVPPAQAYGLAFAARELAGKKDAAAGCSSSTAHSGFR
jgi:hypothetical protein